MGLLFNAVSLGAVPFSFWTTMSLSSGVKFRIKPKETCFHTAGYKHRAQGSLWFQHQPNISLPPAHTAYLHIRRLHKWHGATALGSLVINARIWLSTSGPRVLQKKRSVQLIQERLLCLSLQNQFQTPKEFISELIENKRQRQRFHIMPYLLQ